MIPTKTRNNPGVFLSYCSEGLLFDCGENIQRQFQIKGISLTKVTKILITHWHGDHTLGLPGLIQTLGSYIPNKTLEIYGPKGTIKNVTQLIRIFPNKPEKRIKIKVKEVSEGVVFENGDFSITTLPMNHGIPCVAYSFVEKDKRKINKSALKKIGIPEGPLVGKIQKGEEIIWKGKKINLDVLTSIKKGRKLSLIPDTLLVENCYVIAQESDILICESTYLSDLKDKAEKRLHLTSKQAALIAKNSKVKKLILTHFSRRYKDTKELEKEARKIFKNTIAAKDFMDIEI
ncbi:MAG: ribonuclease Z [Sulfurovaceae bacterium]|nr:ribonuclease Z [Sulfurovaceae bacterium]